MERVQLARQPIFDRELVVVGYELLFRDEPPLPAGTVPGPGATPTVVLGSLTEIGLDQVVGDRRAWINVPREFLLGDLARTLPRERVVLEILEGQTVDDELIAAVAELRREGYEIALDDFAFGAGADALLPYAHVVKLDLLALGRDGLAEHVRRLRGTGVELLAEKVETHEEHGFARSLGCVRFQGFFYRRPELLTRRQIDAGRTALMRLIAELGRPDLELDEIAERIGHDVGLSVRLLRYINSAYLGLPNEITSVGQAVALLGPSALRRWAMLSAFVGLGGGSSELTRTALVRARFCELADNGTESGQRFTIGLFSVIDALTGMGLEEALATLPFPAQMRTALIERDGPMGRPLRAVVALEEAAFGDAEQACPGATELYLEALGWADAVGAELADDGALTVV